MHFLNSFISYPSSLLYKFKKLFLLRQCFYISNNISNILLFKSHTTFTKWRHGCPCPSIPYCYGKKFGVCILNHRVFQINSNLSLALFAMTEGTANIKQLLSMFY